MSGMVLHACNPSSLEAEVGQSRVQPGLQSEFEVSLVYTVRCLAEQTKHLKRKKEVRGLKEEGRNEGREGGRKRERERDRETEREEKDFFHKGIKTIKYLKIN
jgi:hypothetical protein